MGIVVDKGPCPKCKEKGGDWDDDNLVRYDDGSAHCFACKYHEKGEADASLSRNHSKSKSGGPMITDFEYRPLLKRKITEETCKHFQYGVGRFNGKAVHVANYRLDGKHAQKIRFPDKDFRFLGDTKEVGLFGQNLWRDAGKMLVITEGEIDALTVSQLQNNRWPVCSIKNGASGAAKEIGQQIEWIERFDKVIFMFDMDEPGRAAAKECAAVLSPGKAFIAELPLKDANECLVAGRGSEVIDAMWGAKEFRPDGLVGIDDIIEQAEMPVEWGVPWCFPTLTEATYGRRPGEVYGFGAGTGVGKTDVFTQQIAFDITELGEHVGVIYLEQSCVETAKRIAGKVDGKRYHVPDAGHTPAELKAALQKLKGKVTFYDNFGRTDWDIVAGKIRYMVRALGIKHIYLDHLTALADPSNERESLETIMEEMAMLAKELGCIIHYISHLTTPEGKPHEEGGRVMIRHFKGSRAIGFWSYFMFGLERNQQEKDEELRKITTFRILKDRYTGQSVGKTFGLKYDEDTGILNEAPLPSKKVDAQGFKPEEDDEY